MAIETLDIRFPLAGQSKVSGFQNVEPFSTPYAVNCRPKDVFEGRIRGGSRPMLAKAFSTDAGTGSPVRLLNSILTGQELPQSSSFEDSFSGSTMASGWSVWTPSGAVAFPATATAPDVGGGRAYLESSAVNDEHRASIRDAISYNSSDSIILEAQLFVQNTSSINAGLYHWGLAMGLGGTSDYNGAAVVIITPFSMTSSSGVYSVQIFNQGTQVGSTDTISVSGRVVRVVFIPGGTLQLYMGTPNNLVKTVTGVSLSSTRIGFQMWHDTGAGTDFGLDYIKFNYTPSTSTPIAEPAIVKSVSGSLYYESVGGTITAVTGQDTDLADDRLLVSAERFGKLYIADYEVIAEGIDGVAKRASGAGTNFYFDSATYSAWGSAGLDDDGQMLELFSGGSGTYVAGIYAFNDIVDTTSGGALTLDGNQIVATIPLSTSTAWTGSAIPFRIVRAIKVFDYRLSLANKLTMLVRKSGTNINPPLGCTLAAIWLDRLCLSGDPKNPGDTYMSKQGDPTNWTEDTTDTSPVFGEFDTNARINEPVTALIPFSLDYLVFGGVSSIHVLRGNPVRGGTVDAITRAVGVIDKFAWCITPEGFLLVMTGDGLYIIDPMAQSAEPISRERLPQDFIGFDTVNNDVQLGFDVRRNGVLLAVTPKTAGTGVYYWFDWQTKGFWSQAFYVDHHPTAMTSYVPSGESTAKLVLGGRDGYLREFRESATTDDGVQMDSDVLIGPIALGAGGYWEGMLREVIPQMSAQSGNVRVSVQTGKSIEDAYNATPRPIGTARPGKGLTMRPNLRGNCCFLRISSIDGSRWAYEQTTVAREQLGKQRLLSA